MQKTLNTLFFSLMVASLLIAIHQSMTYGFAQSYWLFMVTFLIMMMYQLRANYIKSKTQNTENKPYQQGKSKKSSK